MKVAFRAELLAAGLGMKRAGKKVVQKVVLSDG